MLLYRERQEGEGNRLIWKNSSASDSTITVRSTTMSLDQQISSPDSFENPNLRRLSTRRGTMAVLANRRASCQYYPFSFCVIIILVDVVVVVVVVVMFDLLQIH